MSNADFITLTFVVRKPDATDLLGGDTEPISLITDDSTMFWGSEDGISAKALELGADPSMWDEEGIGAEDGDFDGTLLLDPDRDEGLEEDLRIIRKANVGEDA